MSDSESLAVLLIKRLRESGLDLDLVIQFTGADPFTVKRWPEGTRPTGGRAISLWHLLAAAGIDSPELDAISDFSRYLGALLAYQVISLDDARAICKVQQASAVFAVARGERRPANATRNYDQLVQEYGERLEKARGELQKKLAGAHGTSTPKAETPTPMATEPAQAEPAITASSVSPDLSAREAADRVVAALVLLNMLAESPQEYRETVRRLVGPHVAFDLAVAANLFCSERALTQGKQS